MKRMLIVMCSFTLLATVYLSLSVAILRPPRLNDYAWFLMAGLFIAQSVLTLAAVTGAARNVWVCKSLLAGSIATICVGAWWVHGTLSGSHFEGYALVLGLVVAVQGTLTLLRLFQSDDVRVADRP